MGMVKKSITVTNQQDEWIKAQIASGHYGNDSEVVRDLIRREQIRKDEIEAIRTALIQGEQSGISDRTPEEIFAAAKARLKADGKL
ncbi:MAG: type II toxin-antitoxin system ParD family antitoxin [Gammaproteobacteria bacterium]